jgi:hypothetical protein
MVCYTKNHWVYVLCLSSGILNIRKHMFRKLNLFPSSGEGREIPTHFGPLEKENLNHWSGGLEVRSF